MLVEKLIIAGTRNLFASYDLIESSILHFKISPRTLMSGGARGIDSSAEAFAEYRKKDFIRVDADWVKYGKAAGPIRNRLMAKEGDVLLAIWDGKSRGTKNMIEEMTKLGKPVFQVILKGEGK